MTLARDRRYEICHLFLSPLRNESRLYKELATAEKLFPAEALLTIGLDRDGDELTGKLQDRYPFERIRLWSRRLPKSLPFQLIKYVEWTFRAAWRARASQARVLHCHSLGALLPSALANLVGCRRRILYDAHELETRRANMSRGRQKASAVLERLLMPFVDEMLVVGPSIRSNYEERYPGKRISTLLNLALRNAVEPKGKLRACFGIPSHARLVIYIGGLAPMRGIDLLLDAHETLEDWHCIFLGAGPLESEIQKAARDSGRVHHHPPVVEQEVISLVAEADLSYAVIDCSVDSYRFALPNKLFQSLSAGVPVMVNVQNVDMLSVGKDTGMVFGVNYDSEAVREFMVAFSKKEVPRIPQNYSWESQEYILISAYERLFVT